MGRTTIDLEHLARHTDGEKMLNAEVLCPFDEQFTRMVAELNGALASRQARRWRELAHSIKGAARGVSAFPAGDLAARTEPIDPADMPAAREAVEKLEREAKAVHAFLAAYLAA